MITLNLATSAQLKLAKSPHDRTSTRTPHAFEDMCCFSLVVYGFIAWADAANNKAHTPLLLYERTVTRHDTGAVVQRATGAYALHV